MTGFIVQKELLFIILLFHYVIFYIIILIICFSMFYKETKETKF